MNAVRASGRDISPGFQNARRDDLSRSTRKTIIMKTQVNTYVGTVAQVDSIAKSADWTETIQIGGQSMTFKLDTGAQANLLPADVFVSVKSSSVHNKLECTNLQLEAY